MTITARGIKLIHSGSKRARWIEYYASQHLKSDAVVSGAAEINEIDVELTKKIAERFK